MASERLLESFPLQHQRARLRQRRLLRPLGLVRIPGSEVDVHDGNPRLGLERGGELLGEVERLGQQVPADGVAAQVVRRDQPAQHPYGALEDVGVPVRVETHRRGREPVPRLPRLLVEADDEEGVQRVHDGEADVEPLDAPPRDGRELVGGPRVVAVPAPGVAHGGGDGGATTIRGHRAELGLRHPSQALELVVVRGGGRRAEPEPRAPVLAPIPGGGVEEPREIPRPRARRPSRHARRPALRAYALERHRRAPRRVLRGAPPRRALLRDGRFARRLGAVGDLRVERGGPRVAERGVVATRPRDDLEEQEDREGPRPRSHPARPAAMEAGDLQCVAGWPFLR
mmetsp:Transcript_9519/g.37068  ORF Transcript_9519/g.37068 Transcript_9519/m.37068 type:complete len:342 (+) Transcript_9519:1373-2398(+)